MEIAETTTMMLILVNLVLGIMAGVVMHRSDFCMAGMFRDLFLFRQTTMLQALLLLIVTSMVLIEGGRLTGQVRIYPFPWHGAMSMAHGIGGMLFGIGMVLAGGCVVGTLYKMGSGSVLSAVTFVALVLGNLLYVEIHPWWATFAKQTSFLSQAVTLPQMIGIAPWVLVVIIMIVAGGFFYSWFKQGRWERHAAAEGYLQPWKAAFVLAGITFLSVLLVGLPMAITTSYAKLSAYLETFLWQGHVEELAFFQAVSLKFSHPVTGAYLEGGAGPSFDAVAAIQFPLISGITLGAALSALLLREFKLYFRVPGRQYVSAIIGGLFMAMGARMASGCNVWYLMGGLPILQGGSLLFGLGLFPGAYLGTKILAGIVLNKKPG